MSDDSNPGFDDDATSTAIDALTRLDGGGTLDRVFELLSNRRRRQFLYVLYAYGETLALADAADEVARLEHGRPLEDISPETVKQVYMSLYHSHVPKLVEADVLRYDQELDLVALTPDDCAFHDPLRVLVEQAVETERA
jgi:hypothetical protein